MPERLRRRPRQLLRLPRRAGAELLLHVLRRLRPRLLPAVERRLTPLYRMLYAEVHDLDEALPSAAASTRVSFAHQWTTLRSGRFLLSDPWFRANVHRIVAEEELQLKPEWFAGKRVLDAGCGNGRWSYGLLQLGADVTAVDVDATAVAETRRALADLPGGKRFLVADLEELPALLGGERFDLVFSWGVLHHVRRFNRTLRALLRLVGPAGVFYTYLYGRESLPLDADLVLFRERLRYHALPSEEERRAFLLDKAGGDAAQLHSQHDIYAPLVNRRLDFDTVKGLIRAEGFAEVERTVTHTELFVRALRGDVARYHANWLLPRAGPPYWFQRPANVGPDPMTEEP